jgi:hypothetical protein
MSPYRIFKNSNILPHRNISCRGSPLTCQIRTDELGAAPGEPDRLKLLQLKNASVSD